ncbi:uracil-DNA glycosylase [Stakelama marina]|uniref:Uracil-DNA glycosylase n=1 Tax=Stakelama marina TaxID=2826939 RepID=A0A8T4IA61_9SPHN|nr:uracil-DNA glycosylase [Stakelama marina]MBR0551243.1 uracil-DNA glycosylase [Stakelama marina]
MGADQHTDWQAEAASALEWWRDAGVDVLVEDEPRDWLARRPTPDAVAATPVAEPAALPDTLDAFVAWRTGEDAPEAAWNASILSPQGNPQADLMVIVDMPETGDADAGTLVSGPAGRLLDRMLAAIGLDRDHIYLSSLALARPLTGTLPPGAEDPLAELTRHHIGLAAPKRVLLLGQTVNRAVLGPDGARQRGRLHAINHLGREFPTVASLHPRFLLERPAAKAESWKDLQLLTGGR